MRKRRTRSVRWRAGLAAWALLGSIGAAPAPLVFSTAPDDAATRRPAPNVIVSVDDAAGLSDADMETMRIALRDGFSARHAPEGSMRLGWQSMNACPTLPAQGACKGENALRPLDATQRERFRNWAGALKPSGTHAAHRMLYDAGHYLRAAPGIDSPWASLPGVRQEPMLSCRRAYQLFITTGEWDDSTDWQAADPAGARSIGNADGRSIRLPDGTAYEPFQGPATRPFQDRHGVPELPTLADIAFHHWATDLQPALPDRVAPRIVATDDGRPAGGGASAFWNPSNDPATWQHLNTFTVGYGAAAGWRAPPRFGTTHGPAADATAPPDDSVSWPDPLTGGPEARRTEPWHMALNGRGRFFPARDAASLTDAFRQFLAAVRADHAVATSVAMVASTASTREAGSVFVASHDPASWSGDVAAYGVADGTASLSGSGLWRSAMRLDDTTGSPDGRVVLSSRPDGASARGIAWRWNDLPLAQRQSMDGADGQGQERLAYLRGDRSLEAWNGGTFRQRRSRLGDIVNSRPWHLAGVAGRTPMLYVGANDGMLHGFSTVDGSEKLAYVPLGLHGALPQLADPGYAHRYFVDGSAFTGELSTAAGMRSYLAGFLGAGGKGYFVLDVTDPAGFREDRAAQIVVIDRTASDDPDIGHVFGEPVREQTDTTVTRQITRLNDGRWALVVGNGYNSSSENAVLLIQYLDGDRELRRIAAAPSALPAGNGLSSPRLVDLDGNGTADVAYAGDLRGQLWKFDLSGANPAEWNVAFDGRPLFTTAALATPGSPQPITTAPVWLAHPQGGVMLVFGTGRLLTDADRADIAVQSIYGIHDDSVVTRTGGKLRMEIASGPVATGRSLLVAQTLQPGDGTPGARGLVSSNPVPYEGAGRRRGWYLDLPAGERVIANPAWFEGRLVDVPSTQPARNAPSLEESCDANAATARSFRTTLHAIDGNAPKSQLYADAPQTNAAGGFASRDHSALGIELVGDGGRKRTALCLPGHACIQRTPLGRTLLRPSWRQLQ